MRRRGGLGRGLEALIPSSPQDDQEPATEAADQESAAAGASTIVTLRSWAIGS